MIRLKETLICPQHDICTLYKAYVRAEDERNVIRRAGTSYLCSALDSFLLEQRKDAKTGKALAHHGGRADEISCGCLNLELLNLLVEVEVK